MKNEKAAATESGESFQARSEGAFCNPNSVCVTFDKFGRVDVFCSVHENMHCVVLVLDNPYFALADDRNHYSISNVPPGAHQLTAWHERMPPQTKTVIVPETGEVNADFVLGITGLPKY